MKLLLSLASDGIVRRCLEETDCGGYVLRTEMWSLPSQPSEPETKMCSAYTRAGQYIGNEEDAKRLCDKYGIAPQVAKDGHKVCSYGFSSKDGKWYGWSHRAIYGFKIGDSVKPGDCAYDPERGPWTVKTEEDAQELAKAFAESVSSADRLESLSLYTPLLASVGTALVVRSWTR